MNSYTLTVDGVASEKEYGSTVTATAAAKEGHTFTSWSAEGIALADATAATQSFAMPSNAVTLTAVYTVNSYTLTVDGAESECEYGSIVEVTAEERKRYEFTGWTAEGVALVHPEEKSQSFAMPANDVTLSSNYTTEYVEQHLDLRGGWNLVTVTGTLDEESRDVLLAFRPFAYDAENRGYVKGTARTSAVGTPLWIYCHELTEVTLYGKPVGDVWTLGLMPGWNCVGAAKDVPTLPANAIAWEWNQGRYAQVTGGLKAGKAYWILVE